MLCILGTIILAPLTFFNVENPIRLLLAVPFLLFIPGYVLIFTLFPLTNSGEKISMIERIGLSVGVSIALAGLIGLGLNYTPWGIRLEPLLLTISLFNLGVGALAIYRWHKINPEDRFSKSFTISLPASENKPNAIITIILTAAIIVAGSFTIYIILTPKIGERFTEFYVLGPTGSADNYPQNLTSGQNTTLILGISNHEYRTMNYTIGIWLVNQSTSYDATNATNVTVINNMWFMDTITITLNSTTVNAEEQWKPQWQYNYTFNVTQQGRFKLTFLLFTTPQENFITNTDYKDKAESLFEHTYREIHLWITIM